MNVENIVVDYDIFICYKETEVNSDRQTRDSKIADKLYIELCKKGYKVFLASQEMNNYGGYDYGAVIHQAIEKSPVMLVLSTDKEYYNTTWMKNEYSRFAYLMKTDNNRKIINVISGIDGVDIPANLRGNRKQWIDYDSSGPMAR